MLTPVCSPSHSTQQAMMLPRVLGSALAFWGEVGSALHLKPQRVCLMQGAHAVGARTCGRRHSGAGAAVRSCLLAAAMVAAGGLQGRSGDGRRPERRDGTACAASAFVNDHWWCDPSARLRWGHVF